MKIIINIILLLSLPASTLFADTIYKSIDKDGRVTYSTTPPANSEKSKNIDIAAPPSEERIKAAQERQERNKEAADIMDDNRKKRDEITAEENRLKREKQKQLQQQQQAEKNNENNNYGYPYIPGRRPGGIRPGPIQLPAR